MVHIIVITTTEHFESNPLWFCPQGSSIMAPKVVLVTTIRSYRGITIADNEAAWHGLKWRDFGRKCRLVAGGYFFDSFFLFYI